MTPITRFRFSKQRVEALPIPADGRAEYRNITTPGLVLRVTATGARSFSLFRRVNGRPARVTLGAFPAMTVEQAQRRARELQGQIVMGIDPRTARRKAREEPTLSVLFQFWMDTHAKLHKRTWEADQRQYDSYLKPWAGRALSAIKKADVAALQLRIAEKKGRYIANKVLALLRAMFNRAGDIGFDGPNPTAGIKKFPEEKRDRFLHGDDLRLFFAALASDPNGELRDYFLVCLFVGAPNPTSWPCGGRKSTSPPACGESRQPRAGSPWWFRWLARSCDYWKRASRRRTVRRGCSRLGAGPAISWNPRARGSGLSSVLVCLMFGRTIFGVVSAVGWR